MANRATNIVSAVFVSAMVAAIPVSILAKDAADGTNVSSPDSSTSAAATSSECLTAPNRESSPGQHWFYRMEPGTNRRCWYARDQAERASQTALPRSNTSQSPSSNTAQSPPALTPPVPKALSKNAQASRSLSNARAELGTRSTGGESAGITVPKEPVFITTGAAGVNRGAFVGTEAIAGTSATLTSSESSDGSLTGSADVTAADGLNTGTYLNAGLSPSSAPEMPALAMPQEKASTSLQVLFLVILGALAFAGIMASQIHRVARIWGRRHARFRRSSIWVDIEGERRDSAAAVTATARGRSQDRRPTGPQRDGHSGQIKRLLAQIAKQAGGNKSKKRVLAKTQAGSAARARTPPARRDARASAARP